MTPYGIEPATFRFVAQRLVTVASLLPVVSVITLVSVFPVLTVVTVVSMFPLIGVITVVMLSLITVVSTLFAVRSSSCS